jgi:hypothetical protein
MAFRALFVGINKHQDPGVLELTGAARDAQAFQALFQDTFTDIDARLLVDLSAVIGDINKLDEWLRAKWLVWSTKGCAAYLSRELGSRDRSSLLSPLPTVGK